MFHERVNSAAIQQRWEYRCETVSNLADLGTQLNNAGAELWELVQIIEDADGSRTLVYKRPTRVFASLKPAFKWEQEFPEGENSRGTPEQPR